MGESLFEYLRMKVHPDIQGKVWKSITVKGSHYRAPPFHIASIEKTDKPFNWQRPTTSIADGDTLELHVFPGHDYVKHYAAIVATYLSLKHKPTENVIYYLPTPNQCMDPLLGSNLINMGGVDIVILGYVNGLHRFTSGTWQGTEEDDLFSWQISSLPNGRKVAFVGCRICFWGDIGGNVVRTLQKVNQAKCVLYIGKLGTLRPEHEPNTVLATGNRSMVRGTMVQWKSALESATSKSVMVKRGLHYSLPSVLQETTTWLEDHRDTFDWVDPEIGQMAQASVEGGTDFGFLHIVSDNLAHKYAYDLSNERLQKVLEDRQRLLKEIEDIVEIFLVERGGGSMHRP